MTFSWTPHRFSGGALALDLANSVILRHDDRARIDRLADPAEIARFADAAGRLSADQKGRHLVAPAAPDQPLLIELRESIDRHLRTAIAGQACDRHLAALLQTMARALQAGEPAAGTSLLKAAATSALALLASPDRDRLKICAHCGWLFADSSRNRSRTWCDMAVCGNRVKAARHYARSKGKAS